MAPSKSVTLALASFMDSAHAASLSQEEADVKKIVGRFLSVCYDDLKIEPEKLDGQDMHGALGHVLPGKFERGSALAEEVPDVLRAYIAHLEESAVLSHAFELKQGFETTISEFLHTVKTGTNPHGHGHHAPKEPFAHGAPKLGRNDPCSCGSGKKYKKCHGKNA